MQWEPLTLTNETEESRDECIIHTFSINCYQQWSMDSWMATCRRMTFSCWVFVCLVDWFWVFVSRLVFSTYFFVVSLVYYLSEKESYHWAQACLEPAILLLQPLPPPYWNYKLVLPHPLKSKSYFPQCAKLLSKAEQTYEGHPLRSTPVSRWGLPSSFSDVSSLPTSPSIHLKGPAVSSIFFVCNNKIYSHNTSLACPLLSSLLFIPWLRSLAPTLTTPHLPLPCYSLLLVSALNS